MLCAPFHADLDFKAKPCINSAFYSLSLSLSSKRVLSITFVSMLMTFLFNTMIHSQQPVTHLLTENERNERKKFNEGKCKFTQAYTYTEMQYTSEKILFMYFDTQFSHLWTVFNLMSKQQQAIRFSLYFFCATSVLSTFKKGMNSWIEVEWNSKNNNNNKKRTAKHCYSFP